MIAAGYKALVVSVKLIATSDPATNKAPPLINCLGDEDVENRRAANFPKRIAIESPSLMTTVKRSPDKTSENPPSKKAKKEITGDEAKLYDRQIRLWGLKAQERMRNAHIFLYGCTGLGNEVLKNLVLAGIGSITIMDPASVTERDLGSQFLFSSADIGRNVY